MMNSRDALVSALDSIICASIRRDRPGAAEDVLAAMEGYFFRKQQPTVVVSSTWPKDFNPFGREYTVDGFPAEATGEGAEWPPWISKTRDPDVAELLAAIKKTYPRLYDGKCDGFGGETGRLALALSRVKAKYE